MTHADVPILGAVDRGSRKNVGETAASAAASLESKKRKGKKVALQNSRTCNYFYLT